MKLRGVISLVACLVVASTAAAQRQKQLSVGDKAPQLQIAAWINGSNLQIQPDNVYVIEFWATWCGPCKAAIPHLSELQRRYEADGLRIIGISTEDEKTVRDFVTSRGDTIAYTIAVDNRKATERLWMQAAGLRGIPASFIVDGRGRIQYIGNPHDAEFDRILDLVINSRYDAKLFRDARPMLEAAQSARRMRNHRQALSLYDRLIEVDNYIFAPLEWDKFEIMMIDMQDPNAAYRHMREVKSKYASDDKLLVQFGEKLATDPIIPSDVRDLDLALEFVEAGVAGASNRNDPRLLAVQAKVHFQRGEVDRAASLQRRAWMIAHPERKASYERVLRTYQTAASETTEDSQRSSRGGSFRR